MRTLTLVLGGAVALLVGKCVLDQESAQSAYVAPSAAEVAAAAEAKREADAKAQAAITVVKALRDGMKNPASFELVSVIRMDDGALCVEYRGTNSFGGIVPNYAIVTKGKAVSGGQRDVAAAWNRHCAGKTGEDLKYIRRAL